MSLVFPDLETFLRVRGVKQRDDGSFAEDSYDLGIWWKDRVGVFYRLTWIGGRSRERVEEAGELYLVRLCGPPVSECDLRVAGETESHLGYYEKHGRGTAALSEAETVELARARVVRSGRASGSVELLCVIPPVPTTPDEDDHPDENVQRILDGWEDVCAEDGSIDWVRDRAREAIEAGWATCPKAETLADETREEARVADA